MKKIINYGISSLSITASVLAISTSVYAVDHNNIDANRPLSFDDAESIGFREQSIEFGGAIVAPEANDLGAEFEIEYLYGFAPNTHFNIGIDPAFGARVDSEETDFDIGDVSVGIFHNFNREYDNTPAFAVRADAHFPTGKDSQGVDFRLRGIASKTVGQYDRLHLNLDLNLKTDAEAGERSVTPGVILGYSKPLGYPRRFDRTILAEVGVRGSEHEDGGAVLSTGIGLRQQVGYQSVLDIGLQGDLGISESEESQVRFVVGYSLAF